MASSRFVLGIAISGAFHVLAFLHLHDARASARRAAPTTVIEIDAPPPFPPPPSPMPSIEAPSSSVPQPTTRQVTHTTAHAGHVLAAADDAPPGVADFTMVQGIGAYAGGITSNAGTSKSAVTAPQQGLATTDNASTNRAHTTTSDLSKPARPMGSDWDCKTLFPATAKDATATVLIVVRVRSEGSPESVSVIADPGQGFGQAARTCAMRQRYVAAEDREGRTISSTTAPFRVRFTR